MPVEVIIDGLPNQDEAVYIGNTMNTRVVEFKVPDSLNLDKARIQFCLGELHNAYIDDISIREIIGKTVKSTEEF